MICKGPPNPKEWAQWTACSPAAVTWGQLCPETLHKAWKHFWLSRPGERVLLVPGGWGLGVLLNTLQCTGGGPAPSTSGAEVRTRCPL